MTPLPDPYRVLGLVPGATPGEIRSAYRRLAKLHHPDTAGERSLPRFLAIKAAYEALVDDEGRLRARGWPARGGGAAARRPTGPAANPASRDAWRARQAAGSAGGGGSAGATPRSRPGGASSAEGPKQGSASGGRSSAGGSRAGGRSRAGERRTARPGSTTYDEAAQPLDPSWEGGSWYGASSGSYWTLNPREYADPRKHGLEYQERARRAIKLDAARRAGFGPAAADEEPDASSADSSSPPSPPPPRRRARRPPGPVGP